MLDPPDQDHLLVSYAPADWALAEWLTLRLTTEGYRVWCSRFPMLGRERFPSDVSSAIKERVFHVLALLSHASLSTSTADDMRELALAVARERGVDFLIGLTVDDPDSMAPDPALRHLPCVPFHDRWETGFAGLVAMLRALEAPRPLVNGAEVAVEARQFLSSRRSWHTVL